MMNDNRVVASCRNGSAMKVSRLGGTASGCLAGGPGETLSHNGLQKPRARLSLLSVYKAQLRRNLKNCQCLSNTG